jgi:hypothetical protein
MSQPRKIKFSTLPPKQQKQVAIKLFKMLNGGKYESVEGETARQQSPGLIEYGTSGEDSVLSSGLHNQLTNQLRNQLRNSPVMRIIDQQRRANIVGQSGGNLILNFPKEFEKSAEAWENWFNQDWAPMAEFTDGMHLNDLLKNSLSAIDMGGDQVMVFDNKLFDNSGRILSFESDEVANIPQGEFEKRFPGFKQSQGRIYDNFGRFCGVIVSRQQRGLAEFDVKKCFILTADPRADRRDSLWVMPRHVFRLNQGRGVTPMSSAATAMINTHEIVASETQAAKLNAKMVGQLLDSSEAETKTPVPAEFAPGQTDDDAEVEDAANEPEGDETAGQPELTFDDLDAIGAVYDLMPPKLKMELLDTKRPNPNMPGFIDWLVGMAGGVYGFSRPFATLNPIQSYAGFKAGQSITKPSIVEAQKSMERYILDWVARNAFNYAIQNGLVSAPLPANWKNCFEWEWEDLPEVNKIDAENANEKGLQNATTNYGEILGKGSKKKLLRFKDEVQWFRDNKLTHPSMKTVSGAIVESTATKADQQEQK